MSTGSAVALDPGRATVPNWRRLVLGRPGSADAEATRSAWTAVTRDERYDSMALIVLTRTGDHIVSSRVRLAFSDDEVVSLEPAQPPVPFDTALERLRRGDTATDAHSIAFTLVSAISDATADVVDGIGGLLGRVNDDVVALTTDVDPTTRDIGVSDVAATTVELGDTNRMLSFGVEALLALGRAARLLRTAVDPDDEALRGRCGLLVAEVEGGIRHARFEQHKAQFLEQKVAAAIGIKQNQIIKVFTIVTAVFLPPMLVNNFYGQNFEVMPELSWEFGLPVAIGMTIVLAVLPLVFLKAKGWLR